jgi:hypothetical protein
MSAHMTGEASAKYAMPAHFKTFAFGREGCVEPLRPLEAAPEPERSGWREVGQTFQLV